MPWPKDNKPTLDEIRISPEIREKGGTVYIPAGHWYPVHGDGDVAFRRKTGTLDETVKTCLGAMQGVQVPEGAEVLGVATNDGSGWKKTMLPELYKLVRNHDMDQLELQPIAWNSANVEPGPITKVAIGVDGKGNFVVRDVPKPEPATETGLHATIAIHSELSVDVRLRQVSFEVPKSVLFRSIDSDVARKFAKETIAQARKVIEACDIIDQENPR